MKPQQLEEALSSLVTVYGHKKVQNGLDRIKSARGDSPQHQSPRETAKQAAGKPRRDAVAVAESLDLSDSEKKAAIFDMAKRYEAKKFMPNVHHVRAFLESLGEDVSRVKSRQQVTASVFKKLAELDTPVLLDMQNRGLYGPPLTLGPIADAIGRFGRSRRSHSQ